MEGKRHIIGDGGEKTYDWRWRGKDISLVMKGKTILKNTQKHRFTIRIRKKSVANSTCAGSFFPSSRDDVTIFVDIRHSRVTLQSCLLKRTIEGD